VTPKTEKRARRKSNGIKKSKPLGGRGGGNSTIEKGYGKRKSLEDENGTNTTITIKEEECGLRRLEQDWLGRIARCR